jgi:hypothetical protein
VKTMWTAEIVEIAKTMRAQGKTASDIARFLRSTTGVNFTRNAVLGKLSRMGLMSTPSSHGTSGKVLAKARARINAREAELRRQAKSAKERTKLMPAKDIGAEAGPSNVRFIDRTFWHCPMFLLGEDGPSGLVCGKPVVRAGYCADCYPLVYRPVPLAMRKRAA